MAPKGGDSEDIFRSAKERLATLNGQRDLVRELAPDRDLDAMVKRLVIDGSASDEQRETFAWHVLRGAVEGDRYAAFVERLGAENAWGIARIAVEFLIRRDPARLLTHLEEEMEAQIRVGQEAERLGVHRLDAELHEKLRRRVDRTDG